MKIKVSICLLVLILIPGEYYEGIVSKCDIKGIVVKFVGGLIEGTIGLENLHKDTIYNENENQWILAAGDGEAKGYEWKIGAEVRFKIDKVFWNQPYEGPQEEAPTMADLVHLKANEAGLGPIEWWI